MKFPVDKRKKCWYHTKCADEETTNGADLERYRSGHNEAVLKTVCPQGRVGSNPTLSVSQVAENNLKKLKKVLDKSWRTGYNTQGFSSERLK